jgi:glyoxylase-like metal-dependent hydrolase (beta-lactamase superfamily II)
MNRLRRAAILAGGAALLSTPARAQEAEEPLPIEVARGVFMWRGTSGEPDASNRGRVGNAGFVVGNRGVLAIDSGTSYREGRALLEAIARCTELPVRRLVLTHARQEFVFGAQAFRERGIGIAMQRDAAELMAARCGGCLERLVSLLGADEMRGTVLVEPDLRLAQTHDIDAAGIGRRLSLLAFGHSSGPGDAAVLDVQGGTLFAGGLLDAKRIPDIQDADLAGWRRALAALRTLGLATIVPGHGPAAPANLIYAIERYLVQLESRVRALARANAPLSEVPDATALPEFEEWDGYDTIHRRNASLLFLRFEREGFDR